MQQESPCIEAHYSVSSIPQGPVPSCEKISGSVASGNEAHWEPVLTPLTRGVEQAKKQTVSFLTGSSLDE